MSWTNGYIGRRDFIKLADIVALSSLIVNARSPLTIPSSIQLVLSGINKAVFQLHNGLPL